jgi:hypothetical protein
VQKTDKRESRWNKTPFFPDAVCDVCLSTERVKIGSIPVVLADGRPWPDMTRLWSLCDDCHALGSGLACKQSVEGMLVYLCVRVVGDEIEQRFVFAPMMFRDSIF